MKQKVLSNIIHKSNSNVVPWFSAEMSHSAIQMIFFCHVLSKRGVQHKQQRLFGIMITRGVVARMLIDELVEVSFVSNIPKSKVALHWSTCLARILCIYSFTSTETLISWTLPPWHSFSRDRLGLVDMNNRRFCEIDRCHQKTQSSPSKIWGFPPDPSFSTPVHISIDVLVPILRADCPTWKWQDYETETVETVTVSTNHFDFQIISDWVSYS